MDIISEIVNSIKVGDLVIAENTNKTVISCNFVRKIIGDKLILERDYVNIGHDFLIANAEKVNKSTDAKVDKFKNAKNLKFGIYDGMDMCDSYFLCDFIDMYGDDIVHVYEPSIRAYHLHKISYFDFIIVDDNKNIIEVIKSLDEYLNRED